MTWEVKTANGATVTTLTGLAQALGVSTADAADTLLADPAFLDAAPPELQAEAKAKKPGGGTPPPISTGSFVSWSGGKGRVDLIVTSGKVPGVDGDVEGTTKSPAARVVVYEDGKPTRRKVAKSTHTLRRIAPIRDQKAYPADDPEALVGRLADHEDTVAALALPAYAAVTGRAVKAVYDRGLASWPGETKTVLSRTEWALGRVDAFTAAATGEPGSCRDTDLLSSAHPRRAGNPEVKATPVSDSGRVTVTADMLASDLASITYR